MIKILNKKGTTIIELIISIALLSVVMMFMYRLLADVTFERDSEYFASRNQEQRIEIEQAINDGIFACYSNNGIVSFNSSSYKLICTTTGSPTINIIEDINITSKTIKVSGITYNLGNKGVTNMKVVTTEEDSLGSDVKICKKYDYIDKSTGSPVTKYVHEIRILIGTDNTYNDANNEFANNTIDDIVFSYESTTEYCT